MPSVFTIQGPELFPRARKRTEGRFAGNESKNCYCLVDRRGQRFTPVICHKSAAGAKKAGVAKFKKDKRAKEIVFGAECHELPKTARPATMDTRRRKRKRR